MQTFIIFPLYYTILWVYTKVVVVVVIEWLSVYINIATSSPSFLSTLFLSCVYALNVARKHKLPFNQKNNATMRLHHIMCACVYVFMHTNRVFCPKYFVRARLYSISHITASLFLYMWMHVYMSHLHIIAKHKIWYRISLETFAWIRWNCVCSEYYMKIMVHSSFIHQLYKVYFVSLLFIIEMLYLL